MKKVMEGSMAIAEAVKLSRPGVIAAYPITPQTHIVENLADMVANGECTAQYINVESEHSAASAVLGSQAAGARSFTATSSQGLLLMAEVLFNIAGMRMPLVLVNVNRAVSAPINIWNDQQDSFAMRDCGFIQLFAETNQEGADLVYQAYRIAEDYRVQLPVMVCVDGFIISHSYTPVDIPEQAKVDEYLPAYKPLLKLDTAKPFSWGTMGGPDVYSEIRYSLSKAILDSKPVIAQAADEFKKIFGRGGNGIVEGTYLEDAETVIVAMGSVLGTIREAVDQRRKAGEKIGILKITTYRPFPEEEIREALKNAKTVVVISKEISLGYTSAFFTEIKAALYNLANRPRMAGFICGLGGRDITLETIYEALDVAKKETPELYFLDTNKELEMLEVN